MKNEVQLLQQQSLRLVMTNELRQGIAMLQCSAMELQDYIHELLLENPLIEIESFENNNWTAITHADESTSAIEHISKDFVDLKQFLQNQITFLDLDKSIKNIALYAAQCVDENGYLLHPPSEIAIELNVSLTEVTKAIDIIQTLEPAGVGASSLQQCLLIQMRQQKERDEQAEFILENYFEELANKQLKTIANKENISVLKLQKITDKIQQLNPKPGAIFSNEPCTYVVPDVSVKSTIEGFKLYIHDELLPKLTLNKNYQELMKNSDTTINKYIQKKYEQYVWIKKCIEQRQKTLFDVASTIIEKQLDFLKGGAVNLRPLTLKTVADHLGIHESTVSRATMNKYIETPMGLYPFKYFFTASVGSNKGQTNSSESVKTHLKQMIDNEDKTKPFSDDKLATMIHENYAIAVSRRTVAKYRDEMNIPGSRKRRRFS
ncbi:RNA polymerase factor sigma-54 [Evansella cellulosilytica]|uniref:RNA polymerase, sigma 54 subunit, RpoN n=1 Tax=Evansella cellulosilytica (strain ATCC 21833 / DSM 2522 / FERM P-1141 / JCM 9156 / N-4) TaxID=649639 RepID=E6TRD4_EVAC2|nr:RNA polymerase factor sigma-54 [Evansella cellulosilytica]ADU31764.1 RNA polymerase, sigma 54 subunit, RpoN [Evansella cellulosilytica DSM 2522]